MRKMLFLLMVLLMFSFTAYAKTEEWIDKNYDFSKIKRLIIDVKIPDELKNGIREHEITEVYYEKMKTELYDKTVNSDCKVFSMFDVLQSFEKKNGIVLNEVPYEKRAEVSNRLIKFMKEGSDALLTAQVWVYDLGTSYHEGYIYTLPSTNTSNIFLNNGITGTVTTQGQSVHQVPGGNYPTAYTFVRWDLVNSKTDKPVWSRLDERVRVNMDVLQNTKPKDLLRRIVKSMSSDLLKRLKINS